MGKREALQAIGSRIALPTLPDVVVRIGAMMDDPKCGPQEIGGVVSSDPALTAKVLRVANSSFYGLREPVLSAEQAATVVGVRTLRNIAMQVSIVQRYEHLSGLAEYDLDELWTHSMFTAQLSQALAEAAGRPAGLSPDDYFTCGLLHDVGKVVLLEGLSEEYLEVLRHARRGGTALHLSEESCLGYTHVDVGSILAARWKLPEPVAMAIEFHHGPTARITGDPAVAVVAIADQLAYRAQSASFEVAVGRLADLAAKLLKVDGRRFERVLEVARTAPGVEMF